AGDARSGRALELRATAGGGGTAAALSPRSARPGTRCRPDVSDRAAWGAVIGSIAGLIGGVVLTVACMFPLLGPTFGEDLFPTLPLLRMMSGGIFGGLYEVLSALSLPIASAPNSVA